MTAAAPALRLRILRDTYRDSVELMGIAGELERQPGVRRAGLLMATPANLDVLRDAGLHGDGAEDADSADLVVAVAGEDTAAAEEGLALAERLLAGSGAAATGASSGPLSTPSKSIAEAVAADPATGLALVSVPGDYATAEAWKALKRGLHVFLFSDNVAVEDEVALKDAAIAKGLLLMGPDCGTAIVDGIPLGFANVVARGPVGLVGASGTGLQEVTSLLDRAGAGVSQAIGVGGRDLSEAVGGRMLRTAFERLVADPSTEVVVLISKPPAPAVAARVLEGVRDCGKPVVACFLGGDAAAVAGSGAEFAPTLEAAARAALAHVGGDPSALGAGGAPTPAPAIVDGQVVVRGLYCGGTLASEAEVVLRDEAPDAVARWEVTDLGADEHTRGRAHPMIEPRLRNEYVEATGDDPSIAVVLLDLVLGHGSHPDPAGVLVPAVAAARERAAADGRELAVVASVCGTDADPQDRRRQVRALEDAGVVVAPSNCQAARLAARIANPVAHR